MLCSTDRGVTAEGVVDLGRGIVEHIHATIGVPRSNEVPVGRLQDVRAVVRLGMTGTHHVYSYTKTPSGHVLAQELAGI